MGMVVTAHPALESQEYLVVTAEMVSHDRYRRGPLTDIQSVCRRLHAVKRIPGSPQED